ncbi:MAG: hypothetical protein IPJ45_10165 [Ignavibacteria bacterium]|nr:hypothetical protein [Ignavibacteria bacterium]
MIDANTGVIAADVRTLRTTDGGLNWNIQTSGRGRDIYFTDANTGYCVGGKGFILKSTNGGINWFDQHNRKLFATFSSFY